LAAFGLFAHEYAVAANCTATATCIDRGIDQ
jgi:hypothetical protein